MSPKLRIEGTRTILNPEIEVILKDNPDLHLGGQEDFHDERNHHAKIGLVAK
jgi:hypothetical protein